MRPTQPRLEPLAEENWGDETREMLERLKVDCRMPLRLLFTRRKRP
jgi:hypothetical protein